MSRDPSGRDVLARVIEDVRALPPPELDWAGMERRLAALPRAAPRVRRAAPMLVWSLAAALAIAGAAAFAAVRGHAPRASAQAHAHPPAPLEGDTLALGTAVQSGGRALSVDHPQRVLWTLEPNSSAALIENGAALTLRLERGAVSARVVPSLRPESFAIEVGQTRIAAHGTAFRVELALGRVLVDVSEGTVVMERAGTRSKPVFVLHPGSHGAFGLDGQSGSVQGNAEAVTVQAPAAAESTEIQQPESEAAKAVARHAGPRPPLEPSIGNIEAGVSAAVELVNQCFRRGDAPSNLQITAQTSMTLNVAPSGRVHSVSLAPALAPDVQECAVRGLRQLGFARSQRGATFTRVLELKR